MLPYYILCVIPCFPFLLRVRIRIRHGIKTTREQSSITLFFLVLFLLLALRASSVGRDLTNYQYMFRRFSKIPFDQTFSIHTETGYVLLNKLVALFGGDFQCFLAVLAVISVIPIAIVYRKEVEISYLTIALFLSSSNFIFLFSGLRQSIAIATGMISYIFVKEKRPLYFILTVLAAFLFHRSAIALLLLYPVYHMSLTRKKLLFIIPILVLLFIFNKQIFSALLFIFSDIYSGATSATGAYLTLFLYILFAVFSYVVPDEKKLDDNTVGLRNILLLCIVLQMFAMWHSLAMRVKYYFIIFIPLLIPKIINRASSRCKGIAVAAKYIMVFFFMLYFFINAPKSNSLDTFPYHFFWEL